MSRKRRKSIKASHPPLGNLAGPQENDGPGAGVTQLDSLPDETLQLIFARLPFPSRQHASLVCRRWHDLLLDAPFRRILHPGQSLSQVLQAASPGDTIICPSGMYQETLLVEKPVRLVARDHWDWQRHKVQMLRNRHDIQGDPPHQQQQRQYQHQQHHGPTDRSTPQHTYCLQQPPGAASTLPAAGAGLPDPGPGPGSGAQPIATLGPGAGGGGAGGTVVGAGRPPAASVTVLSLRPPVVVMDSRCCFVGFEFHTSTAHNDISLCCFGPDAPIARFERCTFSGLTGLRVPYSKGSQTRLELYDCTLIGTTQTLAAVQMDAGQLLLARCAVQNNAVGVEVGPDALARLMDCELRWCGSALVVDGCLAMEGCRLWGNAKLGNLSTEARITEAQRHTEARLAAAAHPPQQQQQPQGPQQPQGQQQQQPQQQPAEPRQRNRGVRAARRPVSSAVNTAGCCGAQAGTGRGPAAAATAQVATVAADPGHLAALAAEQWAEVEAAFAERRQLVRVVGCDVAPPQLIMRAGLHKEVRKKARQLVRQVYGAPDDDQFPEWEVLVHSDIDSDLDEEDSSVSSDLEDLEDSDLDPDLDDLADPLEAADDPDLDESGGSDSDSDSDSGDLLDAMSTSGSGEDSSDSSESGSEGSGSGIESSGSGSHGNQAPYSEDVSGSGSGGSTSESSTDSDSSSSEESDSSESDSDSSESESRSGSGGDGDSTSSRDSDSAGAGGGSGGGGKEAAAASPTAAGGNDGDETSGTSTSSSSSSSDSEDSSSSSDVSDSEDSSSSDDESDSSKETSSDSSSSNGSNGDSGGAGGDHDD